MIKQAKNESSLKISLIKSAKSCVRKFEHFNDELGEHSFTKFCSKRLQKILNLKSMPSRDEMIRIEDTLDAFNKVYYNNQDFNEHDQSDYWNTSQDDQNSENEDNSCSLSTGLDENSDSLEFQCGSQETLSQMNNEEPSLDENQIVQLDGHAGGSSEDEAMIKKKIFSVHCEIKDVIPVLTFFRGLSFVWKSLTSHKMCQTKTVNCFFCHMRSSCLRLSAPRGYGPKSLKAVEFSSLLNQYQSILGWNWSENVSDIPTFIEKTLELLNKHESKTASLFGIPDVQCQKCKKLIEFPSKPVMMLIHHIFRKQMNLM